MIVFGAILTFVVVYLVIMSVLVPRRRKRKGKESLLMLPEPPSLRKQVKKDIENLWIRSSKDWCEFYRAIGASDRRQALKMYYPYEPQDPRYNFKNESEYLRADVIFNFVNFEGKDCKRGSGKVKKIT